MFFRSALAQHLRVATTLLAVGILFGLFVLGAQPVAVGLVPTPWDKVAHGCVFALLAVSLGLSSGLGGWRVIVLAVAGAVGFGVLDEWHQIFLPGRQAGWDDLAADGVGGLIGALALGFRRWFEAWHGRTAVQ